MCEQRDKLIYSPRELVGAALAEAGGKAASLARLSALPVPVPAFFVISWRALAAHLDAGGIGWDPEGLDAQGWSDLRRAIAVSTIPRPVREQILTALRGLAPGGEPVAVRSSAAGEDSSADSFAGQYVSILGVAGPESLLAAVRQCWASYVAEGVVAYRTGRSLQWPRRPDLAVIVQVQVLADKAGVAFTRHPVMPELDAVCIEANFGTGESVVGGMVTPDSALVTRSANEVQDYQVAGKRRMTVVSPGGGGSSVVEVEPERRRARALSDDEVREVARLALQIEDSFGGPQDVEWAIDPGGIWILQARPITTLGAGT